MGEPNINQRLTDASRGLRLESNPAEVLEADALAAQYRPAVHAFLKQFYTLDQLTRLRLSKENRVNMTGPLLDQDALKSGAFEVRNLTVHDHMTDGKHRDITCTIGETTIYLSGAAIEMIETIMTAMLNNNAEQAAADEA